MQLREVPITSVQEGSNELNYSYKDFRAPYNPPSPEPLEEELTSDDDSLKNSTVKLFVCQHCFFKTQSIDSFKKHNKKHEATSQNDLINSTDIIQHLPINMFKPIQEEESLFKEVVEYEKYSCCMCHLKFIHERDWIEHETNFHTERLHTCDKCRFRTNSRQVL
jgi:hypothetical protein